MISDASSDSPLLVLNAAEERLQVVLGYGSELLCAREQRAPARGITLLPEGIQQCLQESGLQVSDLAGIACVRGPGAFTGLRVSLSIALGLSQGADLPTCGIDYLPLIAEVPCRTVSSELWVMTHARINTVNVQGFTFQSGQGVKGLNEPASLFLEQAGQLLQERPGPICLVGSGLRRNMDYWRRCLPQASFLDQIWDKPSASTLLWLASRESFYRQAIQPLYLRPSEAQVNLSRFAAWRGVYPPVAGE